MQNTSQDQDLDHWGGDTCWTLRRKYKTQYRCEKCGVRSFVTERDPKYLCKE